MKKITTFLLLLSSIVLIATSCKPENTSETKLGDVVSAQYDSNLKSFVVKFSSGQEKTYPAVIDNNVNPPSAGYVYDEKTYLYAFDATVSGEAIISKDVNIVSQFVHDGLSLYYYWADELNSKEPKITDVDPEKYFYKILNSIDTKNGWSWITDDVNDLLAGFSGKELSFGYNLGFSIINNEVYAFIKYVHAGTPAAKAGLQRLDFIGKLNGKPISTEQHNGGTYVSSKDMELLYGNHTVEFTTYKLVNNQMMQDKTVTITPDESEKDPVIYDNIYTIGGKKIGYLFYSNFYDNFNYRLYEVFNNFKQNGVTDLVLDLRYNTGGSISAATYLASLIAPASYVKNNSPFVVMDYNKLLNTSFDKWYNEASPADKYKYDRKDYLGGYNGPKESDPLGANLNLEKVYILATGGSYSASELVTFCLKPYMDVVHIGSKTGGKYTGSWTIHAYDKKLGMTIYDEDKLKSTEKNKLKDWAMQPIVAIYADKDSKNFSNPGYLTPKYELNEGFGYIDYWTPLGNTKDVLLGQALYLISNDKSYQPVQPKSTRNAQPQMEISAGIQNVGKPLFINNIKLTSEDFQKLRKLKNREENR